MIIIIDARLKLWWVTDEVACERYSFCGYPLGSRIVCWRKASGITHADGILKLVKSFRPIAIAIHIFSCEPPDHVAIDKVESEQGAGEETSPWSINQWRF